MTSFSSLRLGLVGTVLAAITPALVLYYFTGLPWIALLAGLLALAAAWFGGERFVLRKVNILSQTARQLAGGDLSCRTGLDKEGGELGDLARALDRMAEKLQARALEREQTEKNLLNRSLQQTVVSALGQFALTSTNLPDLLNQAVILVAQTLEVEYCIVLELTAAGKTLLPRAGVGWKNGHLDTPALPLDQHPEAAFVLKAGEPAVVEDATAEHRFGRCPLLADHGVVSSVTVAISGQIDRVFGILGAYTTHRRTFTEDEVHFLLAVATVLAMAVERERTQAQFLQAQKMESVGQLAAGVAHDFNNLLTIIQGHSGMLLGNPQLAQDLREPVQAIYSASDRAANLTRQLLMFSRKGMMQPRQIDLRDVVGNMSKMLHRLIGETVTLKVESPEELPMIKGDTGMLEQILMNLAVNARDAMPKGGSLTVSIEQTVIVEPRSSASAESRPGTFVCMRVADTGSGMDAATMGRVFEPFFTTKEVGKGTGLGLATVYGIAKQHEGWIDVTSEVGKGATFSLFLPATSKPMRLARKEKTALTEVRRGKETILVVEDEPVLRETARLILMKCGYVVLEAKSGLEALQVWAHHRDSIDLVVTDMVMPDGISGTDLARKLYDSKPTLKVIVASGYSMEGFDTSFLGRDQCAVLEKPFTHVTLAKVVRDCLDRPPVNSPTPVKT